MRYRLLGPVQIVHDGRPVEVEGTKTRALLASLLINANVVLSVDRLIEDVWGDQPPRTAVGTLQVYVSRLRAVLGPDVLVTRRPGYELVVAPEDLDVACFERLLGLGRSAARAGHPQQVVPVLRQALGLWRGPCLTEFRHEPFALTEVARLENLWTAATEECLGAELAMGRHREVVTELERLVTEHPTRETLWCYLMLARYRCGRQVDALDAYRVARERLSGELGVEPGPALRDMQRRVLIQDPTLSWVPANLFPARVPAVDAHRPIVGRSEELGQLLVLWQGTRDGAHHAAVIAGEAGIGKTRLAAELARQAHGEGGTVLWGQAVRDNAAPYQPVAEALRDCTDRMSAVELSDRLGADTAYLRMLIPELPDPESAPSVTHEPKARRYRMFEAVAGLLRSAGAEAPVLLILDDVHQADRSTLLLIDHLVRHPRLPRCMLVCAYRDTDVSPEHPLDALTADLCGSGLADRVRLDGLSLREVVQLMSTVSGGRPAPSVARAVHERTRGNPMFVEEILRGIGEVGDPEAAVRRLPVPERVRDVVARRLGGLPAPAKRVLGAASALGHHFSLDVLAAVLEQSERTLLEVLEAAAEAGIIREEVGSSGRYTFAHPLVHDALYEGLTKTRRASLHRRAGEILERIRDGGPARGRYAELARHFRQSALDDANRAVDYAFRAGDEASALLGFAEARSQYEQALELLRLVDPTGPGRRRDILLALGRARLGEYDFVGARRAYLEAARLSLDTDTPEDPSDAVLGIMWSIEFGDYDPEIVAVLENALSRSDPADSALRAKLLASLVRALPAADPRIPVLAPEAVAMSQRLGDSDTSAFVRVAVILSTWGPHNTLERLAMSDELVLLADELGWVEVAMDSRHWRASALEELGDAEATAADLESLAALAAQARQPYYAATVAMRRASRALAQGHYDEAERQSATMLALGGEVSRNFRGAHIVQMFALHRDRGRLARTAEMVAAAMASSPDIPAWRAAHALLQLELGHRDHAAAELRDLVADNCRAIPHDWLWAGAIGHLAEVCAGLGDAESAPVLLDLLRPFARRNIVVANGVLSTGSADRHLGLLLTVLGECADAAHHFQAAVEVNARWNARPWLARTERGYADLLRRWRRPGDAARGDRLAASARAIASTVQMSLP